MKAGTKFLNKLPWPLGLVLIIYLGLAVAYSVVVPIGRGADEWAHYWYAQFIAEAGRLPQNPAEREAAGYKSDWPPLYHLFAAGLTGWVETEGPPTFKYREGNIRRQLVPAQGPEAILHTEDEMFPWQQEILIWHLGRLLSIGFSLATLGVTYVIALELFVSVAAEEKWGVPAPPLALASTALLAFNPRFLFTGMLFNYDSLTLLVSSLFLWLSLRIARGRHLRWGFWGLGLIAGLALVTKYLTALLLLVIPLLAVWQTREDRQTELSQSFSRRLGLRLGQAGLAYLLVTGWWFGYLITHFNEIERYGPVLGALAPVIRGDGSDRTVEEIFAYLSGGQAPAPDYIEKQAYSAWRIVTELPTTFWGNAVVRPYPLNWFIIGMTAVTAAAALGLIVRIVGRSGNSRPSSEPDHQTSARRLFCLLILYCALPLPFMLIRLFGARDALEAVQGRHILFLAGPAVATLMVWGLSQDVSEVLIKISHRNTSRITSDPQPSKIRFASRFRSKALRLTFYALAALLLSGAVGQLFFMMQTYPSLLPVQTGVYPEPQANSLGRAITLEGGATVIDYKIAPGSFTRNAPLALHVSVIWQAGQYPAPEDYQMELILVDEAGQVRANWRAYQTQTRYPTRAWETGDIIRDEGWLPLTGLPAGNYDIRLRILAEQGPLVDWQTLALYTLPEPASRPAGNTEWILWRNGEPVESPPVFRERETVQFIGETDSFSPDDGQGQPVYQSRDRTIETLDVASAPIQLVGPDGQLRAPVSVGGSWVNYIVGPDWPAGDYFIGARQGERPAFRVSENGRDFQIPEIAYPLAVNFEDKIKLLGYDLPSRRVEPGGGLPIRLYWQGIEWMGEEFVIFNRLLDNRQIAYGGYDRLARENYSTLLWAPGEVIVDGFAIPVAPDAPPGIYTLNLGWYREVNAQAVSLSIIDPDTGVPTEMTAVTIGPIKVGGAPPGVTVAGVVPQYEQDIALGDQIELAGFDIGVPDRRDEVSSSSRPCLLDRLLVLPCQLNLTFFWRALTRPEANYTVFVHIRNEEGDTVAQKDRPPAGGAYPTSLWDAGEIIKDELYLPLEKLEPGRYELLVGMYEFVSGTRLIVQGRPDGTVLLSMFEVVSQ